MLRICLALVLFTSLQARVLLAQPSLETVQKWFDQEWEQAQTMPDFGDCSISWTLEIVYVPPTSELKAMAQRVEGHPDHPDKVLLDSYKLRLKGQFDRYGRRMWVRSNEEWRVNQEIWGMFDDSTITKSHAWRSTPAQLIVTNPTKGTSSYDRIAGLAKSIRPELSRLMHGGLSYPAVSFLEPGPLQLNGDQWQVVLSRKGAEHELQKYEKKIVGRWDAEAGRGFVESMTIIKSARTDSIGRRVVFRDWRWVESLGQWVAGRVETTRPDGRPDRNLVFDEAICDPALTFKKVVKIPHKTKGDLIRGPIEFGHIENHRKGVTTDTFTDGTVITSDTPTDAGAPSRGWRRWMGVAVMMALAIGFVSLYLKRRSAA